MTISLFIFFLDIVVALTRSTHPRCLSKRSPRSHEKYSLVYNSLEKSKGCRGHLIKLIEFFFNRVTLIEFFFRSELSNYSKFIRKYFSINNFVSLQVAKELKKIRQVCRVEDYDNRLVFKWKCWVVLEEDILEGNEHATSQRLKRAIKARRSPDEWDNFTSVKWF